MPESSHDAANRPTARSLWSGSITFGLVSVPVELVTAQRRARPPLRMLGPEGTPLVRQYICPKEHKVLDSREIVRGYEVADGKFVVVTDEELKKLAPRSSRDIELTRFVNRDEIDPSYFERSYYLVPAGGQTKAYRLLAETMERSNRAGIASFVMRGTGYAVAIFADNGVLRAETLRFGDEVRTPKQLGLPAVSRAKAAALRKFKAAIEKLDENSIDESELEDDEVERILDFAEKKRRQGKDVIESSGEGGEEPVETQVIDLMQELQRRLKTREARSTPTKGRRTASKSRHRSG